MRAAHNPNINHAKEAYQEIPDRKNREAAVYPRLKFENNEKGAYHHEQQAQKHRNVIQHLADSPRRVSTRRQ
jgi:hypothetical protein